MNISDKARVIGEDVIYNVFEGQRIDKDGNKKKVTDWSGTRFLTTTKDGHDVWLTISVTDISSANELNQAILTSRKLMSDVTLDEAKRVVFDRTFAVSDDFVQGATHWFLFVHTRGAFHPIRTPSKMHTHTPRFTAFRASKRQGLYGLNPSRPLHGKNTRLRTAAFHAINGNMQDQAGQVLGALEQFGVKLVESATSLLDDMNEVAKEVKKMGDKAAYRRELVAQQTANVLDANSDSPRLDRTNIDEATLVERQRLFHHKRARLLRLEGLEGGPDVTDLRAEVALLKKERDLAQQKVTFDKWNALRNGALVDLRNELPGDVVTEQLEAFDLLDQLMGAHEAVVAEIARQQAQPLFLQNLAGLRRYKGRIEKAVGLIERVMAYRTELINSHGKENPFEKTASVQRTIAAVADDLVNDRNHEHSDIALARAKKVAPGYLYEIQRHVNMKRFGAAQMERLRGIVGDSSEKTLVRVVRAPILAALAIPGAIVKLPWEAGFVDYAAARYDDAKNLFYGDQSSILEPISKQLDCAPQQLQRKIGLQIRPIER